MLSRLTRDNLVLDEPEPLRGIERSLRHRTSSPQVPDVEAEALRAAARRRHSEADLAIRELAKIIAELGVAGLESQLGKARALRSAIIAAAEAFNESAELGA